MQSNDNIPYTGIEEVVFRVPYLNKGDKDIVFTIDNDRELKTTVGFIRYLVDRLSELPTFPNTPQLKLEIDKIITEIYEQLK